jgi:hypothetical protein
MTPPPEAMLLLLIDEPLEIATTWEMSGVQGK